MCIYVQRSLEERLVGRLAVTPPPRCGSDSQTSSNLSSGCGRTVLLSILRSNQNPPWQQKNLEKLSLCICLGLIICSMRSASLCFQLLYFRNASQCGMKTLHVKHASSHSSWRSTKAAGGSASASLSLTLRMVYSSIYQEFNQKFNTTLASVCFFEAGARTWLGLGLVQWLPSDGGGASIALPVCRGVC